MINQGNAKFTMKLLKEMLRFFIISRLIFHCKKNNKIFFIFGKRRENEEAQKKLWNSRKSLKVFFEPVAIFFY